MSRVEAVEAPAFVALSRAFALWPWSPRAMED